MIRCALIGLGRIASILEDDAKREKPATHAGAIRAHGDCSIIAGCDISRTRMNTFAARWNCPSVYQDHRELLENHTVDILHIATPPETHLQILTDALSWNIPVIILEKPVAGSLEEAREAERRAGTSPSRVLINHERRYSLQYQRCKTVIRENTYGQLLGINTKLYMGRTRSFREMLIDDGTHMLDLIHYLTEGFFTVQNTFLSEESGQLYASGVSGGTPVLYEAGRRRDHLVFELDLSFERGRINVGNGYYNEYSSQTSPFYEHYRSLLREEISFPYTRYFTEMFSDAVRCYRDQNARPVSSIGDGVSSLEAIYSILDMNS